jgi:hypothetical protein
MTMWKEGKYDVGAGRRCLRFRGRLRADETDSHQCASSCAAIWYMSSAESA